MIGPFIFDHNLNGVRYLDLLQTRIIPAIRNIVPPEQFNELWFQQDGCPAHNTRTVREFLTETFGQRVISNNGPIPWPARSPDLTPLDFYLWGFVKNEIYEFDPPENREVLEARVLDSLNGINRNTLRRVTNSVRGRCERNIQQNGAHIEQFN